MTKHSIREETRRPRVRACIVKKKITDHSNARKLSPAEHKQKLQAKKLCFNCTEAKHQAVQCRSRATCFHCKRKHSSICEVGQLPTTEPQQTVAGTTTHEGEKVFYPLILVKVNETVCRALLDTGATVSYASAFLLALLKLVPTCTTTNLIQTITGIVTKEIETFDVQVSDFKEKFTIPVNVTKVDRRELLPFDNPNYREMIAGYSYLKGVYMEDMDTKKSASSPLDPWCEQVLQNQDTQAAKNQSHWPACCRTYSIWLDNSFIW